MKLNLRAARMARRITRAELSSRSGISWQTIAAMENNEACELTSKMLVALADALKVTVQELFL